MADLQSMTLQERMVTIINAEHSLSYGINDLSFQEACNKWLIETGSVNGVDYSGININKYTPEEAFAIIRHKIDLRSETLNELVSELGSYYPISKYTATEALNKKNAVLAPYSLSFDGIDDYVSITNITLSGAFTMSAWVNTDGTSTQNHILGSNSIVDTFRFDTASNRLHLRINSTGNNFSGFTIDSGGGVWYHACITRDGSDDIRAYLNTVESSVGAINNSDSFTIEKIGETALSWEFSGKIDEVSIFNKALTQAEIDSIYAADPQNAGDAVGISNLIGYWKFDEGSGEPQDTSGNDNHGTITGATWTVH